MVKIFLSSVDLDIISSVKLIIVLPAKYVK